MTDHRLDTLIRIAAVEYVTYGVLFTDTLAQLDEYGVDLQALMKRLRNQHNGD